MSLSPVADFLPFVPRPVHPFRYLVPDDAVEVLLQSDVVLLDQTREERSVERVEIGFPYEVRSVHVKPACI